MNNHIDNKITYHYHFTLSDGVEREFYVELDKKTLNLIQPEKKSYPDWTQLKCSKCPICPLDEGRHEFCPVAVNLVDLVDFFKNSVSHEEVDVSIDTKARKYMTHSTVQKALSSLMGIYMVTSSCPVMEKLKPMVRYHLPFATAEETRYRAISMYLLAQYFLYKRGKKPDWELKDLVKIYDDVQIVNRSFCDRISYIKEKEANINALIVLNSFADVVSFSIDENMLGEIELLFSAYLK